MFTHSYAFPLQPQLPHSPSSWVQFSHTLFSDNCLFCWLHFVLLPQWLDGNEISPGIQVISGPLDMNAIFSVPSLNGPLFFPHEGHNYPKCRPSRMCPPFEPPPVQAGILNCPIQPLDIGNAFAADVPDFSTKFYTTVVVKSTKDHTVLPHNANLGSIQLLPQTMNRFSLMQQIILPIP